MSKLEQLIQELCPNGVEYKALGEIATVTRGGNFQKKDYCEVGVPCIHYGQIYTQYGLFADSTFSYISPEIAQKQKMAMQNDIIMAVTSENVEDVCKCIAWLGTEQIAVSGHTAIIHHNQNSKYLTYYFHTAMFHAQKKKLAHGTKVIEVTPDKLNGIKTPVPPLPVQREIVRILDNFAELTARKKQYEYYRELLLTFDDAGATILDRHTRIADLRRAVKWFTSAGYKKLGDIATISRGVRVVRSQLNTEGTYPVFQNSMTPLGYYEKSNFPANTTFIIAAGAAGEIGYSHIDFWAADDCYYLDCPEALNSRYVYYALLCQQPYISSRVRRASVPRLGRSVVERITIPVPPIEEQERIVSILDRFDALCNDITSGLPAGLEARHKQYEYYRDKLLTFKEKTA